MILARIKDKLRRLREIDQHFQLWGAESHRYLLNQPLREQQVAQFETEHQVRLPTNYRDFLLELGDGGAGPDDGISTLCGAAIWGLLRNDFPFLTDTCPFEGAEQLSDEAYEAWRADCYSGCLLIGSLGCGHWTMLIVSGKERGNIWYDHNVEDRGFQSSGQDFITWYECWLNRWLGDASLPKRLERQWRESQCLGFPSQCPKCYGSNIQIAESLDYAAVVVMSWSSPRNTNKCKRYTCCDCGHSVEQLT